MHEISIAQSIIEIAEAEARKAGARSIQVIAIQLGTFTTIVQEALEFAFEIARQGTLAGHARLQIEIMPMLTECAVCAVSAVPAVQACLVCNVCGFPLKIISGEELQFDYIEVQTESEGARWNRSLSRRMC